MKKVIVCLLVLLTALGCHNAEKEQAQAAKEKQWQEDLNPTYKVYSGKCKVYRKTLVDGKKLQLTQVDEGFGKLTLSSNKKSFNFFFNDKAVFEEKDWDSSNDERGGIGYTSNNGASAYRLIAEKFLRVDKDQPGGIGGDYLGDTYEIENYQEN